MNATTEAPTTSRYDNATVFRWIQEYTRRRRDGDGRAGADLPLEQLRERIARHHAPLVESIARKFTGTGEPLDDLVQEGFIGLLSALENYAPEKGVRFSTYATHFITGTIRHFLRDRSKLIRQPAWLQEVSYKVERAHEQMSAQLGRPPTPGEIADVLALPVETVEEVQATRPALQVVPFEAGEENEGADPDRLPLDETSLQTLVENRVLVESTMLRLKPLEQQVLYEFFYRSLSQTEIATKLGISCNYVSVTLRGATQKLGKMLSEADVRDRQRRNEISVIDAATGLYTPQHIRARLEESVSRAVRAAQPVSIIYFRLHGLPSNGRTRDEILEACAIRLRSSIRRMDLAGLWEQDSFLAILAGTGPQVDLAAARLTSVLERAATASGSGITIQTRTAWHPEQGRTATDLLQVVLGANSFDTIPKAA